MKSKKEKFFDNLFEGTVELILSILFLAIGIVIYLIIGLFFNVGEIEELDPDSFILIGIGAFFALLFIVNALKKCFKKLKAKKKDKV